MNKLDFIAFDTETATHDPASLCQIGLVEVENGLIISEQSYLVQPPGNEYNARYSCIHGIDALITEDKPLFPIVWEKIKGLFLRNLLVAHNASFDFNIINSTLDYYKIPRPEFTFECTYQMTGLSLRALAESLSIDIVKHHDALSDARTCANAYILFKQGEKPNYDLIKDEDSINVFAGHKALSGAVLKPNLDVENKNNAFYSKKVVFTGVLQALSREDAANRIQQMGADIDTTVNKRTNYVIVGQGAGPSKLKKIKELNESGADIAIIRENDFLAMIGFFN